MKIKTFLGLSTFQILAYFRRGLFYAFLSLYLHFFLGLSVTESTLYATFGMLASSFCQATVWGYLADHIFNRKIMVFYGELIAAVGHIIVWWLQYQAYAYYGPRVAGYVITFGLTIIEVFWSASNLGWSILLSDIATQSDRSSLYGRLSAIGGVGRSLGVLAAALLYTTRGLEGGGFYYGDLFFITAFIIVISAIFMQLTIKDEDLVFRDSNFTKPNNKKENIDLIPDNTAIEFFDKKFFFLMLIALAMINIGRNSIIQVSNLYLVVRISATDYDIGVIEFVKSASVIFFGLSVPFFVKKLGDWRLFLFSSLFVVICLIAFVISPYFYLIIIIAGAMWSTTVFIAATSYSLISEIIPTKVRGKYFGLYNMVFFISYGIGGTVLTGPISDILIFYGYNPVFAYQIAFFAAAGLVMLGLALALALYIQKIIRTDKNRNPQPS